MGRIRSSHRTPVRRDVSWGFANFVGGSNTIAAASTTAFWLVGSSRGIASAGVANFSGDETVIRSRPTVTITGTPGAHQDIAVYCGLVDWDQPGSSAALPSLLPDPVDGAWDWMWRWAAYGTAYAAGSQIFLNSALFGSSYEESHAMRKMGTNKGLLFLMHNVGNVAVDFQFDLRFAYKLPL